tara:strand:+ start:77490 stop:77723 length:234 start_codon:yes stop_codon:yes gene_type:complete
MAKKIKHLEDYKISLDSTSKDNQNKSISYNLIIGIVVLIILSLESIFILLSSIKKGILKKEVLTKNSDIGFDIIIKT